MSTYVPLHFEQQVVKHRLDQMGKHIYDWVLFILHVRCKKRIVGSALTVFDREFIHGHSVEQCKALALLNVGLNSKLVSFVFSLFNYFGALHIILDPCWHYNTAVPTGFSLAL